MHKPENMHSRKELSEQNYGRISWINLLLIPPIFMLFALPYAMFGLWFNFPEILLYMGTFCFAFPFTMTIIHGHVTIALGALQRIQYYEWLVRHPWGFGFWLRPIFFSTRFRLILLLISFTALVAGVMI